MKALYAILAIVLVAGAGYYLLSPQNTTMPKQPTTSDAPQSAPVLKPIMHASGVISWAGTTIYFDPTDPKLFAGEPKPDIVFVTDIHGDHFSTSTLEALVGKADLIVPQAVKDELPADLAAIATVLANGEKINVQGFSIEGIPMYNLPNATNSNFHTKGRGDGYIIEKDGFRFYIAGDTAGTPEMRALKDIDVALVPMNLPYTMDVDEAADAVLAFKPKTVYPYHYRSQGGFSDVARFKSLVNAGNPAINVVLADWYPSR